MISSLEQISAPGTTAIESRADKPEQTIAPALPVVVPRGTLAAHQPSTITTQPVQNVAAYLQSRKPVMHWEDEQPLFLALPGALRAEVKALMQCAELAQRLVKGRLKVAPAIKAALGTFKDFHWHPVTFRARYDAWVKKRDWMVFVNRSKAGAEWQEARAGLPDEFLKFCAARIGQYKRADAQKEALRSICRQWRTGRNLAGEREPIPGYGFAVDWFKKNFPGRVLPVEMPLPQGWSYSNIMRQIKARNVLPKAAHDLLLQGTALARESLPDVLGTRVGLRFLEEVQFDDVKTDWRVFDPRTGEPMDLWLLIARDRATGMLLGFGMRPARVREDGTQEHLKLRDMKQLCGWLLERYGLPPYLMLWVIENGTATLSEGSVAALQEMLGHGRIKVRYGTMIGGTSPAGYFERRIGNSKSKASLESHNRGIHIIGAHLPGQTGPTYAKRPTDLTAREKKCRDTAQLSAFLPEHLRGQMGYSLLTLGQARDALFQIFEIQNNRTDHNLEGFEDKLEWYDESTGKWMPQCTYGVPPSGGSADTLKGGHPTIRKRKESPVERAAQLVSGLKWDRIAPDIITAFYEHTQRPVRINDAGEIEFTHEGKKLVFASPQQPSTLNHQPSTRLLAYFHPDDPAFLYLTDGKGAIVGVWLQRARVKDADAVAQAIAYQARAMRSARELADELNAPERARLDAMREHNEALLAQHRDFVDVAQLGPSTINPQPSTSAVASGLSGVKKHRAENADAKAARAKAESALVKELGDEGAAAILAQSQRRNDEDSSTDTDNFLKTISGV